MAGFLYTRTGLQLSQKKLVKSEQLLRFPGGDFIAGVGTLFYKGQLGERALRSLWHDFGRPRLFSDLCGSFAVVLRKNGVVYCFNDYFGNYHVYSNEDGSVISSSFLAVLDTLARVRLSPQALYEYIFDSATYGTETLVQGIERLDASRIYQLSPERMSWAKTVPSVDIPAKFDDQVDRANADLVSYFEMLRESFGDSIVLGLSGGYDSRLLLAAALKAGIRPRLFAGGDAGSADVRIAKALAAGLDLPFEHLDSTALEQPAAERFPAMVAEKLDYYDGAGIRGAINDGEEYRWRLRRLAGAALELNGGGGEIYRDFWKLPNRSIPVRDFVVRVMEFKNLDKIAATTRRFDRDAYRDSLVDKITSYTKTEKLTREQVAALYTTLRSTYFAGPTNKEMNCLAYSLLPFAEPKLAFPSYRIPLRDKMYGRFEAEMIRRLNPALAAVPSSYGHRFSEPLPWMKRARESVERHCRNLVPLPLVFAAYRMLRKKSRYNSSPYCYSERYLNTIIDPKNLLISEYLDLERLRALDDPFVLSRALTVELLLTSWRDAAALPRAA
jgi:asparagine synthase (glutamine-hydrolysing)